MFPKIQVTHTRFTVNDLLEKTYIPSFQRLDDKEHADRIVEGLYQYYQTHGELVLIGSISLADMKKDKLILLDGQHRCLSLRALIERVPDLRWGMIRVDIYAVESEEEARQIYQIINSSKKVELFTGDVAPFVIPVVQRYFRDRYPEHCKTSHRPLGLNINLDTLSKHLTGKKVVEKLHLTIEGGELLTERIKQLNQFYSDQPPERFIQWGVKDYDKRYKELLESKNPFYLGLYRNYEWIDRLLDPRSFEEQTHQALNHKRRDIPKMIRRQVWEKHFGSQVQGRCYCCESPIRLDEFHAAHRISVYEGGGNEVENLEPACSQCNIEMGTMNIDEYKKLFH
jgi:hypothetical protein